jgi:hypothetical protein
VRCFNLFKTFSVVYNSTLYFLCFYNFFSGYQFGVFSLPRSSPFPWSYFWGFFFQVLFQSVVAENKGRRPTTPTEFNNR